MFIAILADGGGGEIKISAGWSHWNADYSKGPSAGGIERDYVERR
jgi:hypothetical protein